MRFGPVLRSLLVVGLFSAAMGGVIFAEVYWLGKWWAFGLTFGPMLLTMVLLAARMEYEREQMQR